MRTRHLLATSAVASAVLLAPLADAAEAHVAVSGPGAVQGGYSKLTFRVPTEKNLPTIRVEVALPTDTPIAEVRVQPKTGWTYALTRLKAPPALRNDDGEAVAQIISRIVWTATAGGIKPDEFDEFDVEAGPLPKVAQVIFKVLQTYSDGSVVRWIELPVPGGAEPDHPAPTLTLARQDQAPAEPAVGTPPVTMSSATTSTTLPLAATGAGLSLVALLGAAYAVLRSRRVGV